MTSHGGLSGARPMNSDRRWFLLGLFLTTFSTLAVEILDTRFLSVASWYHLSFLAVSTAMFGMAAGAVRVYLGGEAFMGEAASTGLARYTSLLALAIPAAHLANLAIPIPAGHGMPTVVAMLLTTVVLAIPFYLSGIVVAIALTRIPGPTGMIYAVDLLGAAVGSVGVLVLFRWANVASSMFLIGALAACGASCFHHFAKTGRVTRQFALAILLLAVGLINTATDPSFFRAYYMKGEFRRAESIDFSYWTIHGLVTTDVERPSEAAYWSKSADAKRTLVVSRRMQIDGLAGTYMTRWSGRPGSLGWTQYDLTSLPYHLRKGGNNAVIGVGGGRDILTALWGESDSVTGIEINSAFIDLHEGPLREFSWIANDPRVRLIHNEARSELTASDAQYDVLQMSLIDTWAATGAGAFTLTENGLYTVEAWKTFLGALKPGGLFSVSRWHSAEHASETSRLIALATAALIETGAEKPADHMILVTRNALATLIVSNEPLRASDVAGLDAIQGSFEFEVLLAPGRGSPSPILGRIAKSRTREDVEAASAHPFFDYGPPTDERPYFFNILKPAGFFSPSIDLAESGGVLANGNLVATITLAILLGITLLLVSVTIIGPLVRSGFPAMPGAEFGLGVAYFSLIGMGFMFVQIPLMQRFSVYLGHPTYSVTVILFSMILATGIGSLLSDRLAIEARDLWVRVIPGAIALNLLIATLAIQPLIEATIAYGIPARVGLVVVVVAIASLPLGICFPVGLRLVRPLSEGALPWMWGINGAAGVLASVLAVAVSMWAGISTSLYLAAVAYALLTLPALGLWRRGAAGQP